MNHSILGRGGRLSRLLGGGALVAATAAALAVPASATVVTSPAGTQYSGEIKAEAGVTTFSGSFVTIQCSKAIITWKVESQGSAITAGGKVSSFTYSGCNYPSPP